MVDWQGVRWVRDMADGQGRLEGQRVVRPCEIGDSENEIELRE